MTSWSCCHGLFKKPQAASQGLLPFDRWQNDARFILNKVLGECEPGGLRNGRATTKQNRTRLTLPAFWSRSELGREVDGSEDPDIVAF